MKTRITRFAIVTALSVSALASLQAQSGSASAAGSTLSAGDLALWQDNYGTSAASADGDTDGRDFLQWQRGSSPAASGDFLTWQRSLGN